MEITRKGLNWIKRLFRGGKLPQNRPHNYSKNAWGYKVRGKQTPAMTLYLSLGASHE